jgi:type II secretory pathway component GspD/PulD (secretin)
MGYGPMPPPPETLALNTADPRVTDLAARRPSTRPAVPPPDPVLIDQGERATLIYTCRETRAELLAEAIDGLISPEGSIDPSGPLNSLIVTDRAENVRAMLTVLQNIDRPTAQLLVEARVLEVTLDKDLETELRYLLSVPQNSDSFFRSSELLLLTPGAQPSLFQGANIFLRPFAIGDTTLDTYVRLLLTKGKARILSSPNLLVSPGSESSIITGQEVPIQSVTTVGSSQSVTTQFKRVGIKLRVNLLQLTNDTARLELNPEVSTVTRFITTGRVDNQEISNPLVAIRNVSSTLTLRDGEILTVGGLLSTEDRLTRRGIPLLMDVPLLGYLFQSVRQQAVRTQVIFFLRVHIVPVGKVDDVRLLQPDSGLKIIDELTQPTTQPAAPMPPG